ncbi:MAG: nuclear transport factor 2 family protein [Bacteroidetes bacterium]|nr:nuclear transport factor 2 family protein [Bacteroidota bacterium]
MSYHEKAAKLYKMMDEGQMMEAFEKYYHPDVEVVEATGEVRKGKDAQRQALVQWAGSLKEMHDGGVGSITANEADGVTTVESWMDCTFADGNRMKMEEVAVQRWKGDQIVHERFYYNMPGQG